MERMMKGWERKMEEYFGRNGMDGGFWTVGCNDNEMEMENIGYIRYILELALAWEGEM